MSKTVTEPERCYTHVFYLNKIENLHYLKVFLLVLERPTHISTALRFDLMGCLQVLAGIDGLYSLWFNVHCFTFIAQWIGFIHTHTSPIGNQTRPVI